jgi:hypothetical protein
MASSKSPKSPAPANLPCPECEYVNEAERVYCHNCGAKLDRSLLPKAEEDKQSESGEDARKRISKLTNPRAASVWQEIKTLANVLIFSAVAAAIFLIVREPDDVPPAKAEMSQRFIASDMMDAIDSPQPRRVDFTEAEVNAHLRQILKSKEGLVPGLDFQRAYVNFLPGAIRIGAEQSMFGLPVFSSVVYKLEVKDGKFTPTLLGGAFGRLSVHPAAMQRLDAFFQKLWTALKRERGQMDKMQMVIVQKGSITLVTKGGAK